MTVRGCTTIGLAKVSVTVARAERYGLDWLSTSERARMQAISAARRRAQFLAGRWALRLLLSDQLQMDPQSCILLAEENGAPRLTEEIQDFSPCYLSISHSGDWVAYAVSDERVGIDIEVNRKNPPSAALFTTVFTKQEKNRIEKMPESQMLSMFYVAWTLKEAWFKHKPPRLQDGIGFLSQLETLPACDGEVSNACIWRGSDFTLALVAHPATTIQLHPDCCDFLLGVRSEDWNVGNPMDTFSGGGLSG